jgi:cytochrome c-type biogenesis protein CcmE
MTAPNPRPRRWPALALAGVVVTGVAVLVTGALHDTLVYYRTPSEVASAAPHPGDRIRLGGQVVPGSVRESGGQTEFRLTDGLHQIRVVARGAPATLREGRDAVVEGVLDSDGTVDCDQVIVKHSNEYRPAGSGS